MGKNIVITGGTSGIGYAIYKSLYSSNNSENNKIVIISRHSSQKKSLFSKDVLLIDADISNKEDVENAAKKAIRYLEGIDILINNAGISYPGSFLKATKEEIERSISVNLLGPLYVTHSFLPHLIKHNGAIIVNITSAAAENGIPGLSVYCASKFGLKGFSEALRKEIAENNIRLIEISPGGVETPIHNTLIERKGKESVKMENSLDPKDVASAVIYAINQPENTSINEIQIRHSSLKMIGTYI